MKRVTKVVEQSTRALLDRVRHEQVALSRDEFNKLIANTGRCFSSREAQEVLQLMAQHMRPCPASHSGVLQALVRERKHRDAMLYLESLPPTDLSTSLFNIAIHSCGHRGDLADARALFRSMRQHQFAPNAHTYQGLIQACVASQDVVAAEDYWATMLAADLVPTKPAVRALLTIYRDAAVAARTAAMPQHPSLDLSLCVSLCDTIRAVEPSALPAYPFELLLDVAGSVHGLSLSGDLAHLVLDALPVVHLSRWLDRIAPLSIALDGSLYVAALQRCADAGLQADFYTILRALRARAYDHSVPPPLLRDAKNNDLMASRRRASLISYDVHSDRWTTEIANAWLRDLLRHRPDDALAHVLCIVGTMASSLVPPPNAATYNAVLSGLRRYDGGRHHLLLGLFDAMVAANVFNDDSVCFALLAARDVGAAARVPSLLCLVPAPNATMYAIAIDTLVRAADVTGALRLLAAMPMKATPFTYAVLFKGLSAKKDTSAALALLEHMEEAHVGTPEAAGLFSLLRTFRRTPDAVPSLLQRLTKYPLDAGVYNAALDIFRRHGMYSEAADVLRLMADYMVAPSSDTHVLYLLTCANAKKFSLAMRYLGTIDDASVDVFNAAIEVCGHAKKPLDAVQVFEGMQVCGVSPNQTTYLRLLHALAPHGDVALMETIVDEMPKQFVDERIWNRLLDGCGHARLPHAALQFYGRLEAATCPSIVSVNLVLRALTSSKAFPLATMETFLENATTRHGLAPDVITFTTLLGQAMHEERFADCQRLFQSLQAHTAPDATSFAMLLRAFHAANRHEWSVDALLETFWAVQIHLNDPLSYVGVLRELAAAGRPDDAHAVLRCMEDRGLHATEACTLVMRLFNDAGKHSHVSAIYDTMHRRGMQPSPETTIEMVVALEARQEWVRATGLFVKLTQKHPTLPHEKLSRATIGRYYIRSNSLPSRLPLQDDDQA
ncbi:hypothetical protein SPRG_00392 [Saprolegnia parasitica CBS 223.65]|uniref:Pentacotripeptide-repeat region of PRORP domain-containing protein n=1 Tax=Saprolegnia parasitica (strain CBS 223.65) TaxID=695850 RepID=A0A067DA78_SAPPC|nr:hypothetical protein SPRG_00392 [Saprolegnia parasitica CBS 223.65]KDO35546.1 hypothetical protein SPRG_00392 [Saprolegnia parasitica CBS 223.65]|eukprot:XP_012193881.1 hypothetical protein SPRG_00392 [Saprolegnia parasitica CBS 223.65]